MWWLRLGQIGIGPLVGAPVGYAVGKKYGADKGLVAGVAASYATSMITLGGVIRAGWAGSNFIRIGTATTNIGLGAFAVAAGYGYALGATMGMGISFILFGKEGAEDAARLYASPFTREVSVEDWADTVSTLPSLLDAR